jgi:hypothetical protein
MHVGPPPKIVLGARTIEIGRRLAKVMVPEGVKQG